MNCSMMCRILCMLGMAGWLNGKALAFQHHVRGSMHNDALCHITVEGDPGGNVSPAPPDQVRWAMQDANFNVLGVVDESGVLAERYEYTPYGQRTAFFSTGANDAGAYSPGYVSRRAVLEQIGEQPYAVCDVGHQGLSHDEDVGLAYNRARTRLPAMGRFIQRDPYQEGMNSYEVTRSNAIARLDPQGLQSQPAPNACDCCVTDFPTVHTSGSLQGGFSIFDYTKNDAEWGWGHVPGDPRRLGMAGHERVKVQITAPYTGKDNCGFLQHIKINGNKAMIDGFNDYTYDPLGRRLVNDVFYLDAHSQQWPDPWGPRWHLNYKDGFVSTIDIPGEYPLGWRGTMTFSSCFHSKDRNCKYEWCCAFWELRVRVRKRLFASVEYYYNVSSTGGGVCRLKRH